MPEATNSAPRSDLATKKSLEDRIAILESGEIRHVDENVLFPPATHKGVNDA